jgi:O-antigen/teichoic acid export membrane protein
MLNRVQAARGTAYIGVQNIIQYVSFFMFYIFAARLLTQQQVGEITFFVFFMNIFGTLTQLAVPVASAKYVSENTGKGDTRTASKAAKTSTRLIIGMTLPPHIALILLVSYFIKYLGWNVTTTSILYLFLASLLTNFVAITTSNLQGLASLGKMAVAMSIYWGIGRALGVFLVWLGFGLDGVTAGWMVGAALAVITAYFFLRGRFQPAKGRFSIRKLLMYSSPVFVYQLMVIAQSWIDVWVLFTLVPNLETLGTYYLAMAAANIVSIAWVAVTTTIFPIVSSMHGKSSIEGVQYSLHASSRLLNFLVIPFGVILAVFSRLIVELVFGQSYLSGYPAFMISSLLAIIPAYLALYVTALQAIGKTKSLIVIAVVSLVTDLAASYPLIIMLGMVGAALARSAMYALTFLVGYGYLSRRVKPSTDFGSLKKTTLFSLTLGVPLFLIDFYFLEAQSFGLLVRFLVLAGLAVLLFFAAGFAWKPLNEDDFNVLRQASPKKLVGVIHLLGKVFCEKRTRTNR